MWEWPHLFLPWAAVTESPWNHNIKHLSAVPTPKGAGCVATLAQHCSYCSETGFAKDTGGHWARGKTGGGEERSSRAGLRTQSAKAIRTKVCFQWEGGSILAVNQAIFHMTCELWTTCCDSLCCTWGHCFDQEPGQKSNDAYMIFSSVLIHIWTVAGVSAGLNILRKSRFFPVNMIIKLLCIVFFLHVTLSTWLRCFYCCILWWSFYPITFQRACVAQVSPEAFRISTAGQLR